MYGTVMSGEICDGMKYRHNLPWTVSHILSGTTACGLQFKTARLAKRRCLRFNTATFCAPRIPKSRRVSAAQGCLASLPPVLLPEIFNLVTPEDAEAFVLEWQQPALTFWVPQLPAVYVNRWVS
jgi:hypothetical protein